MTYEQLFKSVVKDLNDNNKIEALKLMLLETYEKSSAFLYLNYNKKAPEEFIDKYLKAANLYLKDNIPVQHILGYSYFFGYKFIVNENVLIPRPETEGLIELVLNYYDKFFDNKKVDVLDLGTGSGIIPITLKLEENNLNIVASDISDDALKTAIKNSENLNANVSFVISDWFNNIKGRYDIITANPPYIPNTEEVDLVVKKEPSLALYGGDDGLIFYEEILKDVSNYVKDDAIIFFEHGFDQRKKLHEIINKYLPNAKIKTYKDLSGKDRNTVIILGSEFNHDI